MSMNIRDEFVVVKNEGKITPYYELECEMDSNDGDYITEKSCYEVDEWNKLPNFFFLMLSYLAQGYSGKFSHGEDWGSYYGHHYDENKHGLSEEINIFADHWDIMCYSDWGACHSFSDFTLKYYDEDNVQHDVAIPEIDSFFEKEEDMIKAIKEACKEYVGEDYESDSEEDED